MANRNALLASLQERLRGIEQEAAEHPRVVPGSREPGRASLHRLGAAGATSRPASTRTAGLEQRLQAVEAKVALAEAEHAVMNASITSMQALQPSMGGQIRAGDIAWMLTATALVLMMTIPGLALFYGGMVRVTNVLSTLMQCFSIVCLISVEWLCCGYSLAFSDGGPVFGDGGKMWLVNMKLQSAHPIAPHIPEPLFVAYELMFAIITPALICGSFADRMRLAPMLLFMTLWHICVYCPLAHAQWHPNGFMYKHGVIDFAGGNVVHVAAGCSGLMSSLVLGPRTGYGKEHFSPHNILVSVLGASLLWVGWFGFNAGSYLSASDLAPMAMLVTQVSTATSTLSWMLVEWLMKKRPSVLGIISGVTSACLAKLAPASFAAPAATARVQARDTGCMDFRRPECQARHHDAVMDLPGLTHAMCLVQVPLPGSWLSPLRRAPWIALAPSLSACWRALCAFLRRRPSTALAMTTPSMPLVCM